MPVEGALVELRTAADSVVDRTITGPDGGYLVHGPGAGRYVLEAERIGYRSWRSEPFALAEGQSVSRILNMPTEAVRLEALDVRARSACERAGSGRRGAPVARVWDQVRKALTLTSLSAGATSRWVFVKRFYSRARDPRTRRVVYDSTSVDTARGTRPFHALPAERLVRRGFVEPDTGSRPTYYGPSAGTLVSGAFLDTHCMTLTGPEEHDGERWIGLAFRPVEGRNVSDIAGTLWLTEQASELRRLDFRYVHVRLPKNAADVAGGRVDFLRLPTGAWIVSGYRLDLPMLAKGQEPGAGFENTTRELEAMVETGREVLSVRTEAGRPVFDRARATLVGQVTDSTRNAPLAGAVVTLRGTRRADTTDRDGRYRFTGLSGGDRTVDVRAPRLDSLALGVLRRPVHIREGVVTWASFGVPSWRTLLARNCDVTDAGGALVGVVRDATSGSPLAGARLTVTEAMGSGSPREVVTARTTGSQGTFGFCGVPTERSLRLAAEVPGRPPVAAAVELGRADTLERDLAVPEAREVGILGRVEDASTGRPVSAAGVKLTPVAGGAGSAALSGTSDAGGRFRFRALRPGRYAVSVDAAGYGAAGDTVTLMSGTGLRLDVRLSSRVATLAPIRVEVVGRSRSEAGAAFSRRANQIYELDEKQIDQQLPSTPATKDLLRSLHAPDFEITQFVTKTGMDQGVCAQFTHRSAASKGCAAVYLNDMELGAQQAADLLQSLSAGEVCRIQLIPPEEAGSRFGTGSMYGVLLIYTRPCSAR